MYEAGYSSSSRAYESIPAQLGMVFRRPFRWGGEGVDIRRLYRLDYGKLLVATTPRGVCAVRFGENEAALLRELKHDFKAAEIRRDDAGLEPVATQIKEMLKGSTAPLNIPLDLRGTAFQQMVWKELQVSKRARQELHRTGKDDRATQSAAVANACGSNPVAVVVPCHRVVQKNGSLAGYRWGVKRKAALLDREHSAIIRAITKVLPQRTRSTQRRNEALIVSDFAIFAPVAVKALLRNREYSELVREIVSSRNFAWLIAIWTAICSAKTRTHQTCTLTSARL